MPLRKPPIIRDNSDMVDENAFRRELEQVAALPSIVDDIRFVSVAEADAALYGTQRPEASPEKKAYNTLQLVAMHDPATWTLKDKTTIIEHVSQLRRWLDDLESKAK